VRMDDELELKVTIGLAVHNGEATISAAINSLLAQSYRNFRLVISDNASTDSTESICQYYAAHDNRIRYIRQATDVGGPMNFRFVLFEAHTPYFMWAACDDLWAPSFVEKTIAFLEANPDFVCCQSQVLFTENGRERNVATGTYPLIGSWQENVTRFLTNPSDNSRFYGLFRTHALKAVHPTRSFFSLDWAVSCATLRYGKHAELPDILMIRDFSSHDRYERGLAREHRFLLWRLFPFLFATVYCLRHRYVRLSFRNLYILLRLNAYLTFWLQTIPSGRIGERYLETQDFLYAFFGRYANLLRSTVGAIWRPFAKLRGFTSRVINRIVRVVWRATPLSMETRHRIKAKAFRSFRPFVRHLDGFRDWGTAPAQSGASSLVAPPDPLLPRGNWRMPIAIAGKPLGLTIIIVASDAIGPTLALIDSIAEAQGDIALEVIICDLTRLTFRFLRERECLKYIGCDEAKTYAAAANVAIEQSTAPVIGFFDQRTLLTRTALRQLLAGMTDRVALIGPQVVYGDGRLRAAGGIVDRDDGVYGFGRFDEPTRPIYSYTREVDFCPDGWVVRRTVLDDLGGFDEAFETFEMAHVDFALRLRKKGQNCLYWPAAKLVSYTQKWLGTGDFRPSDAWLLGLNRVFQLHANQITSMREQGKPTIRHDRTRLDRVLYVDAETPMPDQNSGSIDAINIFKILGELGFRITFVPESNFMHRDKYTEALQASGVEAIYHPFCTSVRDVLTRGADEFDLVVLTRAYIAEKYSDLVREVAPRAKIIFNTVDLHFLRMIREAKLSGDESALALANEMRDSELASIRTADATIVLSTYESELLRRELPSARIHVLPLLRDIPETLDVPGFQDRADILFMGTFQHPPNRDAVIYFTKEIWPLIRRELPEARFLIVGSAITSDVQALQGDGVEVLGFVENLDPLLRRCRISVIPLRYGAGLKGKLATSMQAGLPAVSTSIGVEGLKLTFQPCVLVADEPQTFAAEIVRLYQDEKLWNKLSNNGFEFAKSEFSLAINAARVCDLLSVIGVGSIRSIQARFERDLLRTKHVYRPSRFWEGLATSNLKFLDESAILNFKRTINNTYFQWLPGDFEDIQMKRLLAFFSEQPDMIPISVVASSGPSRSLPDVHVLFGENPFLQRHYFEFYSLFVGLLWHYVACNDPSKLHQRLQEPALGNPLPVRLGDRVISQDLANSLHEWIRIRALTEQEERPPVPRVLEIGAGYGRLAYLFFQAQRCKYVIVDIAPALFLAQWYLARVLPGLTIFGYRTFTSFREIQAEFNAADICFIGPHQLGLLPDEYFDISVSISSLQEMTIEQIQTYKRLIERKTRTAVYFKQWKTWKNPIDCIVVGRGDFLLQRPWRVVLDQDHPINGQFCELGFIRELRKTSPLKKSR
jgi:putative sugar O-methyltransferase